MNKAKCSKELYCDFLIAAQTNFTCTQLAELSGGTLAHDAVNRWLYNRKMTPSILWEHTQPLVDGKGGYLIIDDTVLDKVWGFDIGLTKRYSSMLGIQRSLILQSIQVHGSKRSGWILRHQQCQSNGG